MKRKYKTRNTTIKTKPQRDREFLAVEVPSSFKAKLRRAAKRANLSMGGYMRNTLAHDLGIRL